MSAELMQAQAIAAISGIIIGALISEDAATIGAASLASAHLLNPVTAIAAAFIGIWVGDLGLYALALSFGPALRKWKWFAAKLTPEKLDRAENLARNWGAPALAVSRFLPGTRLPATVASGFLKMPFRRFAGVTAVCALVWVGAVFGAVTVIARYSSRPRLSIAIVALSVALLGLVVAHWSRIANGVRRWARWEFWPAGLFYIPVVLNCLRLSIKYRGLALPTLANLNQKHGGIIGESKYEILSQLAAVAPENVAESFLLEDGPLRERLYLARHAMRSLKITFPIVIKPDVGQRGAGFKIVHNWTEARDYLSRVSATVILQRYAAEPNELGIFYYRMPDEERGRILAITDKQFPAVIGNGVHTLAELIEEDRRARFMSHVYKKRFAADLNRVVPAGKQVWLVRAGNHCQGCIFRDGSHLGSPELAARIDEISCQIPGFFIGRYDIRYNTVDDLRAGRFTIIELNGAASEATSIYDEKNTLRQAYAVLGQQWELVFRIGAINRKRGAEMEPLKNIIREWLMYQRTSASYPAAD